MNTANKLTIGIVIPCYNESEIIKTSLAQLYTALIKLTEDGIVDPRSFVAAVDDGSKDGTWDAIEQQKMEFPSLRAIKLSRNFGHQNALLAGMLGFSEYADCLISVDADLQDDIGVIGEMIENFRGGSEIVYGVRRKRATDTFLKKWMALGFYRMMEMLGVEIVYNHADFRLIGKRALKCLGEYREVNLFLRGIFPLLGFKASCVYYDRLERKAGHTKFTFGKMLSFAIDGITSFSVKPLRLIAVLGLTVFAASLVLGAYAVFSYLMLDTVPGWTSIVIPLYLLGGIQLFSIGVIGEYLGKIFQEVKQRPRFIVEERLD